MRHKLLFLMPEIAFLFFLDCHTILFRQPASADYQAELAVTLTVNNQTGITATLVGFADVDGDGEWSLTETISASVPHSINIQTVPLFFPTVTITDSAEEDNFYSRFRLSTFPTITSSGTLPDGEVEDWKFTVVYKPTSAQLIQHTSIRTNRMVVYGVLCDDTDVSPKTKVGCDFCVH